MSLEKRCQLPAKAKHVLIPLEDVDTDMWYAFTFNPCDKYQNFNCLQRIGKFIGAMEHEVFGIFRDCYTIHCYPELSPKGRLHLHGRIKVRGKINFYCDFIPRLLRLGTVVMKEIDDYPNWEKYITKQTQLHTYIHLNHFVDMPLEYGHDDDPPAYPVKLSH